jgi:hypothetical protein
MLFDKTPQEVLAEGEREKAQRQREEQEARERWQRDIDVGRRHREERQETAKRFQEKVQDRTPAGRAKAAMEAGATLFQLAMAFDPAGIQPGDPASDHNLVLNAIEALGWRLAHTSYVPHAPSAGETDTPQARPTSLFAVYIFRRSI